MGLGVGRGSRRIYGEGRWESYGAVDEGVGGIEDRCEVVLFTW